jgi:hypothetical protein
MCAATRDGHAGALGSGRRCPGLTRIRSRHCVGLAPLSPKKKPRKRRGQVSQCCEGSQQRMVGNCGGFRDMRAPRKNRKKPRVSAAVAALGKVSTSPALAGSQETVRRRRTGGPTRHAPISRSARPRHARKLGRRNIRLTSKRRINLGMPENLGICGKMVGGTGIEPVTPSMSRMCSPAELTARRFGPGPRERHYVEKHCHCKRSLRPRQPPSCAGRRSAESVTSCANSD